MSKVYPYVCEHCKEALRYPGERRRSYKWKTLRGFTKHKCVENEPPRPPPELLHEDRHNGKQPAWLGIGKGEPCPSCGASFAYALPVAPGLHFACPHCHAELQLAPGTAQEVERLERFCSVCKSEMVWRSGSRGKFWGCSEWKSHKSQRAQVALKTVVHQVATVELVRYRPKPVETFVDADKVEWLERLEKREEKQQAQAERRKGWMR